SNPQNQNKIRRAWVLSLSDNAMEVIQNKIKSAPARHAYYEAIDREVSNKWIELMRKHTTESLNAGVPVQLPNAPPLIHGYLGYADIVPSATEERDLSLAALKQALHG
ncbi:RNA polymerase-binding protein RpbA, partial [Enterococcus faecalis]|uniref:RNA polymerase-binding protein RpbA n=1 Tax=Enterococcus faecalis TaxID=1351 RepID=UPI003984637E